MRIIFVLIIFSTFVFAQVDSIDSTNSLPLRDVSLTDSIQYNISDTTLTIRNHHSWINIAAQALFSPLVGSYCGVVPLALGAPVIFSGNRVVGSILIGTSAVAYVLGSALGVKWAANVENEKGSYWNTALYSGIGAIGCGGISFIIARLFKKSAVLPTYIAFTGGTTIGGILYSNCLAPWKSEDKAVNSAKKISSQKDLIEYSKIIDIPVLTLKF